MQYLSLLKDHSIGISLGIGAATILYLIYDASTFERTNPKEATNNRPEDFVKSVPQEIYKKLDPLNMKDYWYPVTLSRLLTDKEPHGFKLLGEPLVLYRDKNGKAVCAQDLCPHRSAKLSVGSMRDGNLECCYHGWQFGENGQCMRIPSISHESHQEKNVCMKTKPLIEEMGIIFVWPGNPSLAHSTLVPRFMFREREWKGWEFYDDVLDLPFGHDLMVDNLVDNAHVDFTHDGTIGKRSKATYIKYDESKDDSYAKVNPHAFSYDSTRPYYPNDPTANFTFIPPCFVKLRITLSPGKYLYQDLCMIPLEKDKMRLLVSFHQTMIPGLITKYFINTSLGRIFSIYFSHQVVFQDAKLLTSITENLQNGAKYYSKVVGADIMIKRYRDEFFEKAMKKDPWFKGYQVEDIEDSIK